MWLTYCSASAGYSPGHVFFLANQLDLNILTVVCNPTQLSSYPLSVNALVIHRATESIEYTANLRVVYFFLKVCSTRAAGMKLEKLHPLLEKFPCHNSLELYVGNTVLRSHR